MESESFGENMCDIDYDNTTFYIYFVSFTIKQFLWGAGQVQVTLDQLALDTKDDGLKFTKLETLAKSLKISWVKRIYKSDGPWVNLYRG